MGAAVLPSPPPTPVMPPVALPAAPVLFTPEEVEDATSPVAMPVAPTLVRRRPSAATVTPATRLSVSEAILPDEHGVVADKTTKVSETPLQAALKAHENAEVLHVAYNDILHEILSPDNAEELKTLEAQRTQVGGQLLSAIAQEKKLYMGLPGADKSAFFNGLDHYAFSRTNDRLDFNGALITKIIQNDPSLVPIQTRIYNNLPERETVKQGAVYTAAFTIGLPFTLSYLAYKKSPVSQADIKEGLGEAKTKTADAASAALSGLRDAYNNFSEKIESKPGSHMSMRTMVENHEDSSKSWVPSLNWFFTDKREATKSVEEEVPIDPEVFKRRSSIERLKENYNEYWRRLSSEPREEPKGLTDIQEVAKYIRDQKSAEYNGRIGSDGSSSYAPERIQKLSNEELLQVINNSNLFGVSKRTGNILHPKIIERFTDKLSQEQYDFLLSNEQTSRGFKSAINMIATENVLNGYKEFLKKIDADYEAAKSDPDYKPDLFKRNEDLQTIYREFNKLDKTGWKILSEGLKKDGMARGIDKDNEYSYINTFTERMRIIKASVPVDLNKQYSDQDIAKAESLIEKYGKLSDKQNNWLDGLKKYPDLEIEGIRNVLMMRNTIKTFVKKDPLNDMVKLISDKCKMQEDGLNAYSKFTISPDRKVNINIPVIISSDAVDAVVIINPELAEKTSKRTFDQPLKPGDIKPTVTPPVKPQGREKSSNMSEML